MALHYAFGRDRPIITSHKVALVTFVIATLAATEVSRPYAVPIGVLVAMFVVLLWKSAAYLRILLYDAGQRQPNLL